MSHRCNDLTNLMNEDFEFDLNSDGLPKSSDGGKSEPRDEFTDARRRQSRRARSEQKKSTRGGELLALGELLLRRWAWIFVVAALMTVLGFYGGAKLCKDRYTATVQLLRYETPTTEEQFKMTPLTSETFSSVLRAPDLLQRVGSQTHPQIPPDRLAKLVRVDPQVDSDIIKVSLVARDRQDAVDLANLYGTEAVKYTRELQGRVFSELASNYLKQQLSALDKNIGDLQEQFRALPNGGGLAGKLGELSTNLNALGQNSQTGMRPSLLTVKLSEKLAAANDELSTLMAKYTDAHPLVISERAKIESLTTQLAQTRTNSAGANITSAGLITGTGQTSTVLEPDYEIIRTKLHALEEGRLGLSTRVYQAQLLAETPPGNVRVFAPATIKDLKSNLRWVKVSLLAIFMGIFGFVGMTSLFLFVEVLDQRLKTAADVRRVTGLPVIAALGDLRKVSPSDRAQWAFRTWTMLQGRLSYSANHGLVCGITSSTPGEGRSTWISLLAEAASMTGFRVLTIATKPSPVHVDLLEEGEDAPMFTTNNANGHSNGNGNGNPSTALTSNVLASPATVTEKLTGPNSQPMVHIPLPGWVWNLERRKQWLGALQDWRKIDNLVILVELPPATMSEAVLLGSNLPNMIWLTDSGKAQAAETRDQLQTMRHARCNLVGAVLNREPASPIGRNFSRWFGIAMLIAGFSFNSIAQTNVATTVVTEAGTNSIAQTSLSFSATARSKQRAPWQQRLTLGPGDVLDFALFNAPELSRKEIFIGPDGRVSYLEANDVMAAGLTIDELRAKFDEELSKFRRGPRTMITPVAFKSKKYYMLGKVVLRGVYTLDKPLTVLEALARAKGFETGLLDRNSFDLADFQRSFLMRGGKRYEINFEKLFQQGDLSQNISIEPDDYLYFPPANLREVYVLGEVRVPGLVTYNADMSAIAAISVRAGFTEKAYKSRVLVVRGSINKPQTFVVNVSDALNGKAADFKLEPKDIVYVAARPWAKAEDLLDLAITAFIQASVTATVGEFIIKP